MRQVKGLNGFLLLTVLAFWPFLATGRVSSDGGGGHTRTLVPHSSKHPPRNTIMTTSTTDTASVKVMSTSGSSPTAVPATTTLGLASTVNVTQHSSVAASDAASTQATTTTNCKGQPADVIFILDSSVSEGNTSFQKELSFVAGIVRALDTIGPSHTQIGVITFSTQAVVEFDLDTYHSKDAVLDALIHIPFNSGASYTDDALHKARFQSLSANHGRRESAWPIVIVLTDGESSNREQTKREAAALRNAGVLVMAVGIGSQRDPSELEMIASDTAHVFNVTSPDFLSTIEHHVVREIRCRSSTWTSPGATPTTTVKPATTTVSTTTRKPVCQGTEAADIILFLDASGRCNPANFEKMTAFASQLVQRFPFGTDDMQFTVVSYAEKANGNSWFNTFTDKGDLLQLLQTLKVTPGPSNLDIALRYVREYGYAPFHGRREDKPNYAIVVTDCVSENVNDAIQQATALKDQQGTDLMAVGVGSGVDVRELEAMASEPSGGVFLATDDAQLAHLPDAVQETICRSIHELSGSTTSLPFTMPDDMLIG